MIRTISRRDVGLSRRQVDILIAKPRNDLVFQDIRDGALADVHFPDLLDPVAPGLGLAGGAARGGELAVQFEQLLFADEPAGAAGRYVRSAEVDNVVLFLELQDGAIGCRRLRLQLVDPVLQPGACAGDRLVFCAELVVDIGFRDRIGEAAPDRRSRPRPGGPAVRMNASLRGFNLVRIECTLTFPFR
ncbi:hypothetical protein [Bradyrhizobium japonicum]|uniref:hypothetical protein n=1 Tax=Bradyrhizobium japonicum TaxID=375 RepID=UPI003B676A83